MTMIALKGARTFKVRGVAFGIATKGRTTAVAGARLYFITPNGVRTFPKSKFVDSWEEGVLGSDGHEVVLFDADGNFLDSLTLPRHSKVKASPEGLLACRKDDCSFHWWNGQEAWRVRLPSPGVPAWKDGYWYVPFKGKRLAVVRDGEIINEIEIEKVYALKACGDLLLGVGSSGLTWISIKDPERPEQVVYMFSPDMIFDATPSPDCKSLAVGSSKGLTISTPNSTYFKPYKEAVTALSWDEKLVLGWGEYLTATVEVHQVHFLKALEREAEGVKAVYSFNDKLFKVTEDCVGEACPGSVSSLHYEEGLVVAGDKVIAFGKELELGMVVSVASDGKGFLACTPFSCVYYRGKEELWEVEVHGGLATFLSGNFLIASENNLMLVREGKIIKKKKVLLGKPLSVSSYKDKAAVLFERGLVVVDPSLDFLWALGRSGRKVSLSEHVGLSSRRAEVYPLGDPLPLDLGEGDLALTSGKAYLLREGKLIEAELPKMGPKPFPRLEFVMGFGKAVTGIAKAGGNLAVASEAGAFVVGEELIKVMDGASDVSSFDKRFVFVDRDRNLALITDYMGKLFKIKIELGFGISEWVAATEEGFLTCGDAGCLFVGWDERAEWSFSKGATGKPLPFKDGFLIPTPFGVSYVEEGNEVEELELISVPFSLGRCGETVLVGTEDSLIMIDENLEVLGEVEGLNFVVGTGCLNGEPVVAEAGGRVFVGRSAFEVEGVSSLLASEGLYVGTEGGLLIKPSLP